MCGYAPIINRNLSDETCIYSTLMFIQDQSEKHNNSVPCVTLDQPLWRKATKTIQERGFPIVCRLGGFHTLMSFLGSMGTLMKGSGLAESLETVYENLLFARCLQQKQFHEPHVVTF